MKDPLDSSFVHVKISVVGKVQGVGFRNWVKRRCVKLGLLGWCENQSDGSVYIEVEGLLPLIREFLEILKRGPESAEVQEVIAVDSLVQGFEVFEIRKQENPPIQEDDIDEILRNLDP